MTGGTGIKATIGAMGQVCEGVRRQDARAHPAARPCPGVVGGNHVNDRAAGPYYPRGYLVYDAFFRVRAVREELLAGARLVTPTPTTPLHAHGASGTLGRDI